MSKRKIYRGVQTVLCILFVVLLSQGAIGIYAEGAARKAEHPLEAIYTPEEVGAKLSAIVPLLFISIGFTAAGLLLDGNPAEKLTDDAEIRRDLIASVIAQPSEAMRKERMIQSRWKVGGWLACSLCMIPILFYLFHEEHFPDQDLESMIPGLTSALIPWTFAGISVLMISGFFREQSMRRETDIAKEQKKREAGAGTGFMPKPQKNAVRYTATQIALCIAAAVLILMGIMNGSALDVLIKAINICSECIGLG